MSERKSRSTTLLSVEDANRMLPLVRAIVSDLTRLSVEVFERRKRLELLMPSDEEGSTDNIYRDELREIEREARTDSQRLREYVEELRQLGVSVAGEPAEGIVEFPSKLEGRRVMLSWKLGESEVLFYRELDDETRLPLIASSIDGGADASMGGLE